MFLKALPAVILRAIIYNLILSKNVKRKNLKKLKKFKFFLKERQTYKLKIEVNMLNVYLRFSHFNITDKISFNQVKHFIQLKIWRCVIAYCKRII